MNQLTGKYVNVVLSVEGGRGMDFLKNSVHITGNFNNRILESDKIPAEERPQFNTELVWEVEKKDLRKFRSANQPLRVECISTDLHNRKERVGFTLLSLRSAQIIPLKCAYQDVTSKWYKLIGCQADKKKFHPEVSLSLTVRDHLLNEADTSSSAEAESMMPYISEEDTHVGDGMLSSRFPITYLEDGYIQVGDDENAETAFILNLLIREVNNLDTLLPEIHVFQKNDEKYYLSFKILGVAIKTKPFRKEMHDAILLNEKIVVKLLSNETILGEFFQTQNVTVNFYCANDRLGTTTIDLDNILFTKRESKCFFKFPSANGMVPYGCSDKSPFIDIETWLELEKKDVIIEVIETAKMNDSIDELEEEKPKARTVFSNAPKVLNTSKLPTDSGDQESGCYILDKLEKTTEKAQSDTEPPKKGTGVAVFITKSEETVIKNVPLSPKQYNPLDMYKRYVLTVSLKNLLWKKPPKDTKVIFKFLHPKAASYITIFSKVDNALGEHLLLNNLEVKIMYISTQEKAKNLLNAWPPRLVLTDEKERCLSEEYEFITVLPNHSCAEQDILLKVARTLEPLAKIGLCINLTESCMADSEENSELMLLPAVLDEEIAVKEITDLVKWKEKEKNRFDDAMEGIKSKDLKKLQQEWEQKKNKMEEQLNASISKCKKLQETLQNKVNSLKTEKYLIRKRNSSNLYEEIFKENWKKYYNENTREVIELLSKTQRDNETLKEMVAQQRQSLENLEKSTLTKTQTANLLQELRGLEEKFEEAQNAKSYFKEQWKKACEEIHEIKREDIMQMQTQIQQNKEELSQLSLDKLEGFQNVTCTDLMYGPDSARSGSGSFGLMQLNLVK